jgi:hypothetical protein
MSEKPNRKCVEISLAQDYSAYGRIKAHIQEEDITLEKLEEIVEEAISKGQYEDEFFDLDLEIDYSTGEALRIVGVSIDGELSPSFNNVCLDENAYNLGYATQEFLKGNGGDGALAKLLETAVNANMLSPIETVTMTGTLDFAHETFTAEFQVRKGATQVEMDHAFMCALAQRAKIDYTEVSKEVKP